MGNDVLERLAAIEHERWSSWEKYRERCVAEVCRPGDMEWHEDRWRRLRKTPYDQLTEKEKESDRVEARKSLAVMDAEIARLKADLAAHKRALAAGPAALRAKYAGYKGGIVKGAYDQSADLVERAQADAMKEEP